MLLEISIKNFAIIEAISLNFEKGMTVLTGETGAGKSIIIDAMNMMLGARATTDVIRHGAPKAEIEGLFSVENSRLLQEIFNEQGLEMGDEIIIRREILQNGRSLSDHAEPRITKAIRGFLFPGVGDYCASASVKEASSC